MGLQMSNEGQGGELRIVPAGKLFQLAVPLTMKLLILSVVLVLGTDGRLVHMCAANKQTRSSS